MDGERLAVPRDERVRLRASRARAEVRDFPQQQVVRERLGEERHARRQHAHLDPLPLPRPPPRRERGQDAVRGVEPGELVRHGRADRLGIVEVREYAPQAREGLPDRVIDRTVGCRAARADPGHRAVHEARVRLAERRVPDPHPLRGPGSEVLDDDVGPLHEREVGPAREVVAQVERDALLAAVVGGKLGSLPALALAPAAERVAGPRRLDLDHLGTEVGEEHRGVRSADEARDLENTHAIERPSHAFSPRRCAASVWTLPWTGCASSRSRVPPPSASPRAKGFSWTSRSRSSTRRLAARRRSSTRSYAASSISPTRPQTTSSCASTATAPTSRSSVSPSSAWRSGWSCGPRSRRSGSSAARTSASTRSRAATRPSRTTSSIVAAWRAGHTARSPSAAPRSGWTRSSRARSRARCSPRRTIFARWPRARASSRRLRTISRATPVAPSRRAEAGRGTTTTS